MSINGQLRPSLARRSALLTIDMQRDFALPSSPAHIAGTRTSAHIVAMFPRLILCFRQSRHSSPPHMGTCPAGCPIMQLPAATPSSKLQMAARRASGLVSRSP